MRVVEKQTMVMVIWNELFAETEDVILYNMTNRQMYRMRLDENQEEFWQSHGPHSFESVEQLHTVNNGMTTDVLAVWQEDIVVEE